MTSTNANHAVPTVKLIFSFFLSYPLAGLLKRVPDSRPHLKNFFCLRCVTRQNQALSDYMRATERTAANVFSLAASVSFTSWASSTYGLASELS